MIMAYSDNGMFILDREMWGYLALQGLDLTYEVFGHVVEDDGTIVGLMFEAQVGRLVEYRDRSIIYDAYSRIQQRGLVHCGAPEYSNVHIMNGKVRLTNLASIWYFPDERIREEFGDQRHWKTFEDRFPILKTVIGRAPEPVYHRRWQQNVRLLPNFAPDRPLFIRFSLDNYSDTERKQRNAEVLCWLRRTESSRKRLAIGRGEHTTSQDLAVGRYSRQSTMRTTRVSRGSRHSNTPLTHFSDTDSEKTLVDYARALSVRSSPGPSPKDAFITEVDEDTVWESETHLSS
ncbi:hypothetical protein D9615_007943 [Tricholomella constricta]|uniref:Uncharacterized protein n=1 Tax=Tricholomella constricta TaxID=117010 RepID=A0A8H5H2U6_9AGAR|nr:hypothetical protein D9615_007943 [Tricholomella constricta]